MAVVLGFEFTNSEDWLERITRWNKYLRGFAAAEVQSTSQRKILPPRGSRRPNLQGSKVVTGSMDVKALYPHCKQVRCCSIILETFKNSKLVFPDVDILFLTKFVSLVAGRTGQDIDRFLPKPRPRTTLQSWLREDKETQFTPADTPHMDMNASDTRTLIGWAVSCSIKMVFSNHFFKFGGKAYRQLDGASMGMDLAVELCLIYMLVWDKMFLNKVESLNINLPLYARYVDDGGLGLHAIQQGWSYNAERNIMEFSGQLHTEDDRPDDARTMDILKNIANSIDPEIQMEVDYPSNHINGKMPILDMEIWVEDGIVRHSFYRKPCSSPYTIMYKSAMAKGVKRNTLFQEGIRRLLRTSKEAGEDEIQNTLGCYANMLRISGYDQKYRVELFRGILKRWKEMLVEEEQGKRSRYRNYETIKMSKKNSLGGYNNTWFLRGDQTSMIRVQCTPNGTLAGLLREKLGTLRAPDGGYTKVVELGGALVSSGLHRNVPISTQTSSVPLSK